MAGNASSFSEYTLHMLSVSFCRIFLIVIRVLKRPSTLTDFWLRDTIKTQNSGFSYTSYSIDAENGFFLTSRQVFFYLAITTLVLSMKISPFVNYQYDAPYFKEGKPLRYMVNTSILALPFNLPQYSIVLNKKYALKLVVLL